MSTAARVLFIGLDAAERDLILQWGDEGLLPNLQALRRRSLWGDAPALPGLGSGALWPSFATGVTPSRHGRFFGYQMEAGTYETMKYPSASRDHPAVWEVLSRAGRRVAVINVPYDTISEGVNGLQVVDWAIHNPVCSKVGVWPAAQAAAFDALSGSEVGRACDSYNPSEAKSLLEQLIKRVEVKTQMACDYLDQGGWDLFMMMFDETHCVGHQCWHLHDPSHPRHDPELARNTGDPVKAVYHAIDAGIGRLLERAGPETTVIFFSGTGMGPNYSGNHMLDEILARLDQAPVNLGRAASRLMRKLWHQVPPSMRSRFRPMGRRMEQALIKSDRSRRSAFPVLHNDISGAVRVNLVGREPNGRIQPGADLDAFCRRLTKDLLDIVNVETGERLVAQVVRTAEHYPGDHAGDFADLFVVWNRSGPITTVRSPRIGTITRPFTGNRTGDHTEHGLFMAYSEGVIPGRLNEPVSVLDFAPTIAACLGVALPGAQGRAIDVLFEREMGRAVQQA